MAQPIIAFHTLEFLDPPQVVRALAQRRRKEPKLRALFEHAEQLGYRPATGAKNVLSYRGTYRSVKPIKDPRSAQTVEESSFELNVQDLKKSGSSDQLAIVTLEVKAGRNSDAYECLLVAPGGNFAKAREFMVERNKVVRARSHWGRFWRCLGGRCSTICASALFACSGTWVAYFGCLAVTCGGCYFWCWSCAVCRCRWWCRWAVGCCR